MLLIWLRPLVEDSTKLIFVFARIGSIGRNTVEHIRHEAMTTFMIKRRK